MLYPLSYEGGAGREGGRKPSYGSLANTHQSGYELRRGCREPAAQLDAP